MLTTTLALTRQLSHLWKQSLLFVLLTIITGSLIIYIYAQHQYTTIIGKDYQVHWNILQELQREIIRIAEHDGTTNGGVDLTAARLKYLFGIAMQKCPRLFRVSLFDAAGNLLGGKEADMVSAYYQTSTASAPQKILRLPELANDVSLFNEYVHSVQLPLISKQQSVGFLRGEFFLIDSGATLMKVTQVTLQIIMITAGLMIFSGMALIFSQIIKHLSAKQQRLEEYVVSLERANENLRRTRKELQLSERLASLAYLAAGIAHEIGNPLGSVSGYVELLQKNSLDREKVHDILQRTGKELARIRRIIQELVNFSRPQSMHIHTVEVNDILRKIIAQLPVEPEKTIAVTLQLTDFPLFTEGDEHKLESVFFNILRNSLDAIPAVGRIQITTSRRIRESSQMIGGPEVIAIQFSDTGSGIAEQNLAKIFEPFFTTKDPGKGMGLGLALCHRIIESLNGEIDVQSTPGKGTDVTIFLPPARPKNVKPE